MPIVGNIILNTQNFMKWVCLKKNGKRHKKKIWVVNAYHVDCGDDIMGIYICPNWSDGTHLTCEVFVYQLYLNKVLKIL